MKTERKSDLLLMVKPNKEISISYAIEETKNSETPMFYSYYKFQGSFEYLQPDAFTVIIFERESLNKKTYPRITIFTRLENGHTINSYPLADKDPIFTEELKKIKKIIIPGFYRYFIYSYEFGYITSASFDKITYNEDSKTFYVEYYKATEYDKITLCGELNTEGHLIDDTLYAPTLRTSYIVDEHHLDFSVEKILPKIERDIKRKKSQAKQNQYVNFEYQMYLKRKKK